MAEGSEVPEGPLTPEEYAAAEGLDSAQPVSQEQMEKDLEYEASLPNHVAEELNRMNVRAGEVLPERRNPVEPTAPVPETSREGGMHQPVDSDTELVNSRTESMLHAFEQGGEDYEKAKERATEEMQSQPHTRETIQEFLNLKNAQYEEQKDLKALINSGEWIDPAVIRAKFTLAADQLIEFSRSHPANS